MGTSPERLGTGAAIALLEIYMVVGFLLAAYAVVANDSIQTLGTFLASNAHRPWWLLWLFASGVLLAVLCYGWVVNSGNVAYGRLEKFPVPAGGVSWLHAIPPLALLVLTRLGVPVSTTFLVLTVFAVTGGEPGNLNAMLVKSSVGYVVAFTAAIVLFPSRLQARQRVFPPHPGRGHSDVLGVPAVVVHGLPVEPSG